MNRRTPTAINSPMTMKPASNKPPSEKVRATRSFLHARNVFDSTLGYTEALLQHFFAGRANHDSVPWKEAVRDVEDIFGGRAAEILGEPALGKVEADTRNVLAGIPASDAFSKKWAADSMLARCCYLLCRLVKPEVVLETGVAYGVSSTFILTAMEENGRGMLHSVDIPPLRRGAERLHGIAVPDNLKERWTLHHGSSRRILPGLVRELGEIDFFLHDSLHTRRNMLHEFDEIWPHLRPGGVLLADDVERNGAFGELKTKKPSLWRVVKDRETHPLHGRKAPVTFGVVVK